VSVPEKGAPDIKAVLAAARPREVSVRICVAGDLGAEAERIEAELDRLEGVPRSSLGEASGRAALVAELDEVIALMRDAEVEFRFRGIPPKTWSDTVAQHPARNEAEAWNADTLPVDLIAASCISPVMSVEDVQALYDVLPAGARTELWNAAYTASRGGAVQIPTSRAASVNPPSSGTR
jgi:hypothetical protein